VSYSNFPAKYLFPLTASVTGMPVKFISTNILYITVFFETLNVEIQTTRSVFSWGALLADIGGDIGLFLGLSVISMLEFGNWVIEMIRNRDLIKKLKKIYNKCPFWHQKHSEPPTIMHT
jgi:hypothetical protein